MKKTITSILTVVLLSILFIGVQNNQKVNVANASKTQNIIGFGKNTTGGNTNKHKNIYLVKNAEQLKKALKKKVDSRIIYLEGKIDMNDDKSIADYAKNTGYDFQKYLSNYNPKTYGKKEPTGEQENARKLAQKNQAKQIELKIPENTSIIGKKDAQIKNASLILKEDNIIVQNIKFTTPFDLFPQWDPKDGKSGNWNSQYDAISIKKAKNIWLDHNSFSDGNGYQSDNNANKYFGRQYQHHDGMVDITDGANNISVNHNRFANHDKTMLIGSSDSKKSDANKLNVTISNNFFLNTVQRNPRVRYGKVQVFNNYYQNNSDNAYKFSYVIGAGFKSNIIAQNNVVEAKKVKAKKFISVFKNARLTNQNNIFNGHKINNHFGVKKATWKPEYKFNLLPTNKVKASVLKDTGNILN
ncbi:pectate lyase [Apilactobacillus micheneri]|uniref:Pectate lyase n=1 Tax=Apilactobacillus micheneri TaxID=1899430 RepID=A0ABY2Z0V3_9LACO|nr:pectate lyase [Apilactobacillus micheneri]TPR24565.1 pectate lyase [Apilactobacillus micheneri]TPR25876.1 pectate lyase [Apilactobacillus micheneri]TPR28066.1 pectate lyase [Apilactobacillus micheneri]TPR29557.1 pectate lyase [Apilactobacillus micheneri]TPR30343.1 pectate lyase [Apilactobacillus micheneri]